MVTISLCMIVRDEEAVLGRCLDSVKDIVDEIILVDTGSKDRTIEVARKYTSQILYFPWNDDFSAARNTSFAAASMDYCMWLDADDVLEEVDGNMLLEWKKHADGSADAVFLKYATEFDKDGNIEFCYYRERLLKRTAGFQWQGRVHEAISVSGILEYLDVTISHHSVKKGYSTRNLRIYEKMLAEGIPFCARDQFYYSRELYYHRKYQDALAGFTKFLSMPEAFVENQIEGCRIAAYCCYALGKEKEALEFLLHGLNYKVPSGELCCDLGQHYFDRKEWKQAIFWYRAAMQTKKDEKAGGFVKLDCYDYIPCIQLSVCYDRLGKKEEALHYHRKAGIVHPQGELFLRNEEYFSG